MNKNKENGIVYYSFKNLDKTGLVKNCFTTRIGGVSKGCFKSLNLGHNRGDLDSNVLENYENLGVALKININNLVYSNQTHGIEIHIASNPNKNLQDIDALITTKNKLPLLTFFADCVPLLFLDTKKKIIANAHSGWMGTLQNMAGVVVKCMIDNFESDPKDILACIGPSISQEYFEVDYDVASSFINKIPKSKKFIIQKGKKFHIDLWSLNEQLLIDNGILKNNIEIANICTFKNKDEFYSHRRDGSDRGSMVAIIELI